MLDPESQIPPDRDGMPVVPSRDGEGRPALRIQHKAHPLKAACQEKKIAPEVTAYQSGRNSTYLLNVDKALGRRVLIISMRFRQRNTQGCGWSYVSDRLCYFSHLKKVAL